MRNSHQEILTPVGETIKHATANASSKPVTRPRPVIGLLDNSKPNASFFLQGIEEELHAQARGYETVQILKPRSAGACPDIDRVAERCDYVINAVAD